MTTYSIALVSIYKDHITYYHLPTEPVLNHGTLSSLQQLEPKKACIDRVLSHIQTVGIGPGQLRD